MDEQFKKKFLTDLAIALAFIFAIAGGIFFFTYNIKKFTAKIIDTRQEFSRRTKSITRLAQLRSQFQNEAQPMLNVLYNVIPQRDALIDFAREMQAIAESEKLSFGFSFLGENAPGGDENLDSASFTLNLMGDSTTAIFNFLKKMQTFHYVIKIESFTMADERGRSKSIIKGRVFFRN